MTVRENNLRKLQKDESKLNQKIIEMLIDFRSFWEDPRINKSLYGPTCPIDKPTLLFISKCMSIKYRTKSIDLYNDLQMESGSLKLRDY